MTQDTRSQSQPGYDGERAASVGAEPSAGTETDPLDVPLHCDIRINHIVYRKGVKLRTLVNAATRWHSMLSASPPSPPAVWSGGDSLSQSQPCGDGAQPILPPVSEPSAISSHDDRFRLAAALRVMAASERARASRGGADDDGCRARAYVLSDASEALVQAGREQIAAISRTCGDA